LLGNAARGINLGRWVVDGVDYDGSGLVTGWKKEGKQYVYSGMPGTLAKKRTIPHSPCSSFLFEGFPAIKNLGHIDSIQDGILLIKKIWTSEVGG
jgi:hypothetical protein